MRRKESDISKLPIIFDIVDYSCTLQTSEDILITGFQMFNTVGAKWNLQPGLSRCIIGWGLTKLP